MEKKKKEKEKKGEKAKNKKKGHFLFSSFKEAFIFAELIQKPKGDL